jgi:prolipoprotein diacylglyceryltransferase
VVHFGPVKVTTYALAMLLAFASALLLLRWNARRGGTPPAQSLPVVLAAVGGGILGAKLPLWIAQLPGWFRGEFTWASFFSGRTIVGGLLGGFFAVWLVKRACGIRERRGNLLAPSLALGMAVGRIGCFLTGCCGGTPTALPWGVDFGDGVPRHPTQLYEIALLLPAFVLLQRRVLTAAPGRLLDAFFGFYFSLRFIEEFLRANPSCAGLTEYQWFCLAGLLLLGAKAVRDR